MKKSQSDAGYDAFLSYNSKNARFVEAVATFLTEKHGLNVFFDLWRISPGDYWQNELAQALQRTTVVVVFIGPEGVERSWHHEEMAVALNASARGSKRDPIPVLLPGTDYEKIPLFLQHRSLIEFTDLQNDVKALEALASAIRGGPSIKSAGHRPVGSRAAPDLRLSFDHLIQTHTAIFAGRRNELEKIVSFLDGDSGGYVFVEGLSGYGKTTLLAQITREHPEFAYHFISQTYKTNGSSFDPTRLDNLLSNLCQQMEPEMPLSEDINVLRSRFQRLLKDGASPRRVVIIDAVDEVDRLPNYLLGLLPPVLPRGCFVVLSARTQGDRCYLSEIGLTRRAMALHVNLEGFDQHTVAELLGQVEGLGQKKGLGQELARNAGFVRKLHRLSGGDPFYLRFLMEDIAEGIITAKNISQTPSGLHAYLDQQLSQLNRSAYLHEHRSILGFILTADGSLSQNELMDLAGPGVDRLNFRDIIREIHRFLIVHENRYMFCHNRFKDYFAGKG